MLEEGRWRKGKREKGGERVRKEEAEGKKQVEKTERGKGKGDKKEDEGKDIFFDDVLFSAGWVYLLFIACSERRGNIFETSRIDGGQI